jgi:lauroyl/myristoyl acyltransferase
MDLLKLFTSRFGVNLGLSLGSAIPPKIGYRLSGLFARQMARRKSSPIVRAVRHNQWVVRGSNLDPEGLNSAVQEVFTHAGHCFLDLYQNMKNPEGIMNLVLDSPEVRELILQSQEQKSGAFIVAPHMSNFDLSLLALGYRGLQGQVLSHSQPTGGYQIQNDIRAQTGLEITPVSPEIHKQAIENMRNGGFVITGVDRPIRRKTHYLNFFGRPSPLPVGHIRMAIEAGVPVIVVSASMDPEGNYHIHISEPIPLQPHQDSEQEIKVNGEAVLRVIEARILADPGQWLMYYPVWPEVDIKGT